MKVIRLPSKIKSTPTDKSPAKTVKKPRKITAEYLENAGKILSEKFPASISHFKLVMGRKIYKSCQAHADQNAADCQKLLDGVVDKFVGLGFLNDDALIKAAWSTLTSYAAGPSVKLKRPSLPKV